MITCLTLPDGSKHCFVIPDRIIEWPGPHPDPELLGSIFNPEVARDLVNAAQIQRLTSSLSNRQLQEHINAGLKSFVDGIDAPKGVSVHIDRQGQDRGG
ncbi:hypothetical protein SAMN04487926_1533 [Paraburkholderia steynii]|uniref:Uncharacterized protein n=1 Tax=Paraburkholderia steynii TaxID=1245441 RepID=A0A7Z7FNV2_9BURK|nr:hypothetical protein [Paraburkholderia steynii]SDJ46833.1 hypothetical protein SAMN04487926_1533 [Paraburkholderia steynii]